MKRGGVFYVFDLAGDSPFCRVTAADNPSDRWAGRRHLAEKAFLRKALGRALPRGTGTYKVTLGRVTITRVKETRG